MPRQTTAPSDYPQAVLQQIQRLGQNIAIARQRRGESQAQWAHKLGISQPTMARMERGDPSVAMASYAMCIWLINPAAGLAELIAPTHDHTALEQQVAKLRAKRRPADTAQKVKRPLPPTAMQHLKMPEDAKRDALGTQSELKAAIQHLRTPAQGIAALLAKTAPPQ